MNWWNWKGEQSALSPRQNILGSLPVESRRRRGERQEKVWN